MKKNILLFLFVCFAQLGQTQSATTAKQDIRINKHQPLTEKWAFLKKVLKNKRIVALGESLHGVKEYNSLKLELIQYLHEEMGYNVLAIEADLAMNYFAGAYRAAITDTTLLKCFTPVWHTQEHLKIARYLQAHPQLKLLGFDMEYKASVSFFATAIGIVIDSTATQFQQFLNMYPNWEEVNGSKRTATIAGRDSVMAQILEWIIEDLYPEEKIIISAHNTHIARTRSYSDACMGHLLSKKYKKKYYSLGLYHSLGDPMHVNRHLKYVTKAEDFPKNSIQYQFLQKEGNLIFLPLRRRKKKKNDQWLYKDMSIFFNSRYSLSINLNASFDGLLWVRQVTHPIYIIPNKFLDRKSFF